MKTIRFYANVALGFFFTFAGAVYTILFATIGQGVFGFPMAFVGVLACIGIMVVGAICMMRAE